MNLLAKCGLRAGDEIAYVHDPEITATVEDGKNVRYRNEVMSLSALAFRLTMKKPRDCKTLRCFTFNGTKLEKLQRRPR